MNKSIGELKEELKDIEKGIYMIEMIDHWSSDDYKRINKLRDIKREIENQIREVEQNG